MRKTLLLTITMSVLIGCASPGNGQMQSLSAKNHDASTDKVSADKDSSDQNAQFDNFEAQLLDEYWSFFPGWGTYVGYYKYDDKLIVPDARARSAEKAFLKKSLAKLADFDVGSLSASNATDYALIQNQLESGIWYTEEFREHEWNPAQYNIANIFGLIVNTEYKPLDDRLQIISRRLESVPAFYQAAIQTIKDPTPTHTRLAIEQNQGALSVFNELIPAKIDTSGLDNEDRIALRLKLAEAADAINGYISWLEKLETGFSDKPVRDFRIGESLYEKKFKFDIVSNYSAAQLYRKAIVEKDRLHRKMASITADLWPKYFAGQAMPEQSLVAIRQMIDHLSKRHIDRQSFVKEIRRQMPIIQKFVDDNELLDTDPTRPLVVREAPKYQRGFAGASVDAPGPYDATANTYYNVTPLDDYTPEQAESYLREYNHWILQILNIHEAIPGHYTQLMHANKSPSIIKSVFGNGAMIEGWAVYSELMMMEQGYGNNEAEMWLMYSKWNLRAVINTILDYQVQVLGMEQEGAIEMLLVEGFQERTEAEGKWRRATLSQVQLCSYFSGYAEILDFREELKTKMGDAFDLRVFHNKFLSFGNAPVPIIRKLMLKEWGLSDT